jgi:nucleotide-binding universal stress UspA family protein
MSTYKSLLVHYDASKSAPQRLETAIGVASTFGAHIACLYALSAELKPTYGYQATEIMRDVQKRLGEEMRAAARASYDDCLRRTGFQQAEWRESKLDALEATEIHARYADLVVIGQQDPDSPGGVHKSFEQNLPIAAGRPVLVVPYTFERQPVGKRVLVAWNASREAARAVTDALPILERASMVHVVAFRPEIGREGHGDEPGADIAHYLARHGVKVQASRQDAKDVDVGNQLLSRAADLSVDLIVMGAWGHSRLSEMVLGGVTRTLLESMTVPVLMAH